jgi:hypothetical protein
MSEVSILAVVNFRLSGRGMVNNQFACASVFLGHFAKHKGFGLVEVNKFKF